jgi:DNA gyrase/topoisomerase IV subunit B
MPPLYKLSIGSGKNASSQYFQSDAALQTHLSTLRDGQKYELQRFKGLGEMQAEQLWNTTLNPATRTLKQVTIDDVAQAEQVISMLMGDVVAPRRDWIIQNAHLVDWKMIDAH